MRVLKVFFFSVVLVVGLLLHLACGMMAACSLDHHCQQPPWPLVITGPVFILGLAGIATALLLALGVFKK